MLDTIHAGLGWPIAATLVAVSFAASFITVAFGIGGGVVKLAVLATLLPVAAIVPVHGLVQLGSNAGRTWLMAKHIRLDLLAVFSGGAVIGTLLGGAVVVQLNAGLILVVLGVFILWSVLAKPPAFLRGSGFVTAGFSRVLTMFIGGTGPFVATYVKAQQLDRMTHVGAHAALMTVQHLLKSLAFGVLGFAFSLWAGLIVMLIIAGVFGTHVGRMVLTRIDENRFKFALNAILTVLALRLIYDGANALIFGGAEPST